MAREIRVSILASRRSLFRKCILFFLLFVSVGVDSYAQYFGRNKPRFKRNEARLLQSPNFNLYHYLENDSTAKRLVKWHEWWYKKHLEVLQDSLRARNPIIFYNHHADFQQTNTISGQISVGTGGVAESLKNRVIMPYNHTQAQTGHVVGHEMVHAMQFNMLSSDTLGVAAMRNLPLWLVEGMAEYMSLGREHSHTAMWMRDAIANDRFPTLRQMTSSFEFFPYRFGHAFWAYVTGIWGEEIIRPLFLNSAAFGYERALERVLGMTEEQFSKQWADQTRSYYEPFTQDTTEVTGIRWFHPENTGNINLSPVYSPDARYMAFISEKALFSIDIFLVDVRAGRIIRKLTSHLESMHVDDFNFIESVGTFSPDSRRFAYTVYSKGRNQLVIVDTRTGNTLEEIAMPGLEAFNYISWSPNGRYMVMTGLKEGQSDLYLYDFNRKQLSQLTDDHHSDIQATWSPDGNWIAFVSDRNTSTDSNGFSTKGFNICLLDVNSNEINVLDIFPGADNMNPQFSMDGNVIYFLSNADGFRDLYEYSIVRDEMYRLTSYFTGISGITNWSPALTVARDNGLMAYSLYRNGRYYIYRADPADFYAIYKNSDGKRVDKSAGTLPPTHSLPIERKADRLAAFDRNFSVDVEEISEQTFRPKFKLDYIGNTGEINMVGGSFATGLAGGVNALFSDILGNHQVFSAVSLNGEIFDIGLQGAYINRKNPINWGGLFSHVPYQSATSSMFLDTLTREGIQIPVVNSALDLIRTYETRVGGFGIYPLSRSLRLEGGLSVTHYHFRVDRVSNFFHRGILIGERRTREPSPPGFNIGQVNLAYVGDNTSFGTVGPLRGTRFRFEAERYFGATNFYTALADFRRYLRVAPVTFATRLYHYGRYGQDARQNLLPPLFIGQPTLVRGFTGNSFVQNNINQAGGFTINQLTGNKIAVGNFEVRYPLSGPERLSMLRSQILPTELSLFVDSGMAWDNRGLVNPPIGLTGEVDIVRRPVASTGVSLRANLLGYIIMEAFYAVPWQREWTGGVFGLNFTPAW
ncbi:tolB protein precursor [Lunatimonas lonarensis]|uniref:TolB protein n=1 Tax=Lunatimonas lonarensis TaxID=1232681 RepID=R7ZQ15_9BACT|nr:DPP IV N-terminal domain-containing protein [Lunatimonas lonarensis]EON76182.1 tolB protein precursor [Lunatimonas lonarensis]